MRKCDVSELVGKTIEIVDETTSGSYFVFHTADNKTYHLYHDQECCEDVWLEDVNGDILDLLGSPILLAEEVTNTKEALLRSKHEKGYGSYGWTFYKFATIKGSVFIRFCGESECYSTRVEFGQYK